MTKRRMCVATTLTAVGVLSLAGCQSDPGDDTAAPAPTTQAAPTHPASRTEAPSTDDATGTTSPPTLSAEEQDQADIEETLLMYTRALNEALIGEASVEEIYPLSRDTAREQWITEVMAAQAQGVSFSGSMQVDVLEVSVDGGTATATACLDVSAVEAVDRDGGSVLAENRLDRTVQDYVLERDGSAQLGWYIVDDTNRNEPCAH